MDPEFVIVVEGGSVVNVATVGRSMSYRVIDMDQIKCGEQSFGVDYEPDAVIDDIEAYSKEIIGDEGKKESVSEV